jgi:hypothetical protein
MRSQNTICNESYLPNLTQWPKISLTSLNEMYMKWMTGPMPQKRPFKDDVGGTGTGYMFTNTLTCLRKCKVIINGSNVSELLL